MNKNRLINVARGCEPADLVLKNAKVFHVYTGEFIKSDIAIVDGLIAGIGSYSGREEIDLNDKYILPGLIDAHMHIESSMLSPCQFAKAAISCGVTTIIIDPHEIANVKGIDGIQYMLDATKELPINIYIMLPSCVPATNLENSGAKLLAKDLKPFLDNKRVLGLAEVMNSPGVLNQEQDLIDKLNIAKGLCIDGHAPNLEGLDLMAYAAAGITTDHECYSKEQVLERLRAGIKIMIREGSAAKNFDELINVVNDNNVSTFMFCSDDKSPYELMQGIYINDMIKKAIANGLSEANAIKMATINTASHFNLQNIGGILPGFKADLLVVDNLDAFKINKVFKDGKLAFDNEQLKISCDEIDTSLMENSMNIPSLSIDDFKLSLKSDYANIIELIPKQIVTRKSILKVNKQNGYALSDIENDILKIMVIQRHKTTGNIGKGLIKGFGLKRGAIASTLAHDSHNLIVIGSNDEDMLLCVNELKRVGGGICICENGDVVECLPLPIAGLMTNEDIQIVESKQESLITTAYQMGVHKCYSPFLTMSFMSLPVIPALKITDLGLVDTEKLEIITLEAD